MAHHQKAVAAAVAINTAIFVVEGIAGYQASSLSLLMDSVHNLSDELALVCLYAAFLVTRGPSQRLLRAGNLFNSVGLIQRPLLWLPTAKCGAQGSFRRGPCSIDFPLTGYLLAN